MAASDASQRFLAAAREAGIAVEPVVYPDGTRTAADAAAAVGCAVSQIVKSLVVIGPDGPVLALTAGHNRIDLARLAAVLGGPARMAKADEARDASGFSIGGTPPFGHPMPLPTLIDPSLLDHAVVYGAAGTPDSCFAVAPDALLQVTGARPESFVVA